MPLDINAFRSIASQSPDKLVYVQGESLKTTRNQAHHAAHTYKVATDAFLAAYRRQVGKAGRNRHGRPVARRLESGGQDTIEGYLFKSADSLDYSRIDELDEAHFPFLKEPIATADGLVLPVDKGIRRQLMKEAKLLTELTSPRTALEAEHRQLMVELANLQDGPEYQRGLSTKPTGGVLRVCRKNLVPILKIC